MPSGPKKRKAARRRSSGAGLPSSAGLSPVGLVFCLLSRGLLFWQGVFRVCGLCAVAWLRMGLEIGLEGGMCVD